MPRRRVELIIPGGGSAWGSGVWGSGVWGGGADTVFTLPGGLCLTEDSYETKLDKTSRAFSDGRASFGGEVDDRSAVVEGYIETETRAEMLDLVRALKYQARTSKRLRINPGHFLNLAYNAEFECDDERGFDGTLKNLRIEWQVDDPFWYSESLETRTIEISGNTTFSVSLAGLPDCDRGQHPAITITSPEFLAVTTAQLTAVTDGGLQFLYGDPHLGFGTFAVIDSVAGTAVRSDGVNTIRYLQGEFLRLLPGLNTFAYVGPACTLTFTWRHRWL